MKLLSGMAQIQQLPEARQRRFERFYQVQTRYRVLPLFADISLIITFIGTLLFLAGQATGEGITGAHLVYTAILAALLVAHRVTRLRQMSPIIVYLVFAHMAAFSYLAYIGSGAALAPVVGLFFFLSSVGLITLSLRHTFFILLGNLILLAIASFLAVPEGAAVNVFLAVITNWLILMCLVVAPLSAYFFRLFLRNLLALQFLLKDRNRLLSRTLGMLEATESRLALEQKHQALSHMAKGLLHELMNPLNSASQAVDYAGTLTTDNDLTEALDDARLHQQRMADIVSDLIEFARPAPDHNLENADLNELANDAMRLCRHQLRGVETRVEIPRDHPIRCYPSALTQVFVNLLLNAASALHQAPGNEKRIRISSSEDQTHTRVQIRDNGHGIDPDNIRRLTDPFYSTQHTPDNLGLGLSICQTIMRHHGGVMTIESELGEWTAVTLSIPHNGEQEGGH